MYVYTYTHFYVYTFPTIHFRALDVRQGFVLRSPFMILHSDNSQCSVLVHKRRLRPNVGLGRLLRPQLHAVES
jgi:hypothetical protein